MPSFEISEAVEWQCRSTRLVAYRVHRDPLSFVPLSCTQGARMQGKSRYEVVSRT